jgi:serine/threonine protein kinase
MFGDSTFGAEPNQLRRLFEISLDKAEIEEDTPPIARWDILKEKPGGRIGSYKLVRVLGEGGMGIVYLAEQENPVKREVALKIIKPGMDSERIITRFESEQQTLAIFDHPNIAHVFDAGTTDNGLPYFVMEYVEGLVLTEYCDQHKLCIEDRLTLFLQVCSAIQYAHQKGIIHRDIKPSNILVSVENNQAIPKIIDFGVAKAISQPLSERTLYTEKGQLVGTPEYMSPEQAQMESGGTDTRSDIYSLGVLLYVLLTGVLPFDSETLRNGGIDQIRKMICEIDPRTPSTRLSNLGEEANKVAESRQTEVASLARCLHKELEWIPLKAMHKEPSERYRSVSEFADDIENYLKGKALIAGPPSTIYRLRKFMQRNRMLIIGVAAVLIVFIAGALVSTIFAIRAERQAKITQTVNDFFTRNIIRSFSSYRKAREEVTVLSILDNVSVNLEGEFKNEPLIEAQIRQSLGDMYTNIAEFEAARPQLERALQIYQEHLGEEDPITIDTVYSLGYMFKRQGRYEEAEPFLLKVVESRRRILGPAHSQTLYEMHHLGLLYMLQGRYLDWESLSLELLQASRKFLDEEHETAILAISNAGRMYTFQGRYSKAEPLLVKTLNLTRRIKGENHAWTQEFTGWLGWLYYLEGRYNEAEFLLEQSVEMCRRIRGEEIDILLRFTNFLGKLYIDQGQYEKAERLFVEATETGSIKLGEKHPETLTALNGLGVVYRDQRRYEKAELLIRKALEGRRRVLGNEHPNTLASLNDLAILCKAESLYEEAEEFFNKALNGRRNKLGENHPDTLESKNDLAALYKEQAFYEEAELLLLQAIEGKRLRLGNAHPHTLESWKNLIELYEAWEKPEKAEKWRTKLAQRNDAEKPD